MMGWIKTLFSGGVDKVITSLGTAIDKNVTSDEERMKLKNELESIQRNAAMEADKIGAQLEQEISQRHQLDMQSDDKLSKRVRPMSLIYLLFVVSLLAVTDGNAKWGEWSFTVGKEYIELFKNLLLMVFGFYFGSRGLEKMVKIYSSRGK